MFIFIQKRPKFFHIFSLQEWLTFDFESQSQFYVEIFAIFSFFGKITYFVFSCYSATFIGLKNTFFYEILLSILDILLSVQRMAEEPETDVCSIDHTSNHQSLTVLAAEAFVAKKHFIEG